MRVTTLTDTAIYRATGFHEAWILGAFALVGPLLALLVRVAAIFSWAFVWILVADFRLESLTA